ncbi:two-component regulator propeller domain-containing protein [Candidatus Latescibacterota bacterium]
MKRKLILTAIMFILFVTTATAQESWRHYIKSDGLPANEIRAIVEDASGAKWFGTDGGGVARLDGETWTVFGEKDGLVNDNARELAFDMDGVMWVGTPRGVSSFDGAKWTTYTTRNSGLTSDYVISLAVDGDNVKWFGTIDQGVSTFDGTTWRTLADKDGLAGNRVSAITFDDRGDVWLGTHSGLSHYDGVSWTTYTSAKDGLLCDVILSLRFDGDGVLWCGTGDGVASFDGNSWTSYSARTRYNLLDGRSIFSIDIDSDGVKWFGSIIGVWSYDGEKWQSYTRRESGLEQDVYVRALLTDNSGKKWIGARDALTSVRQASSPRLKKSAVPSQMAIFGNYPNPFNPETTVDFVIPESGNTTVDIYNVTGQKIRSLMSENLPAGKHTVVWDGQNDTGASMSSGVYFVRLESESGVLSHRIMLVR